MAAKRKPFPPKKKPVKSELKIGKTYRSDTGGTVKVTSKSKKLKGY